MTIHQGSAPDRIHSILEADGGWMTQGMVAAEFSYRWPDTKETTIRRAFHRLAATGLVDARTVVGELRTGWNGEAYVTELRTA